MRSAFNEVTRDSAPLGMAGVIMSLRVKLALGVCVRRAVISSWPMKPPPPVMRMLSFVCVIVND